MTAAAANEPTLERGAALEDQLAGGVQRAGDGAEDDRVLAQPALGDLRRQRRQLGEPSGCSSASRRSSGGRRRSRLPPTPPPSRTNSGSRIAATVPTTSASR